MSIQTEITRLQTARNTLRTKAVDLGIATGTDKMDTLATAFSGIVNQGAVSATVQEGDTYTIPKGYHNGSGTVSGVAGGGNYNLQSKSVTPTKSQQNVTPDSGYYGLSDVTVAPIPDNFQDVSSVTATAADVLANKVFVDGEGAVTAGTMVNNGAVSKVLDTTTTSYSVPVGYHNGQGSVSISTEEKNVTPTKSAQVITPAAGKVMSKVSVAAIPAQYVDTTAGTIEAGDVLAGKIGYAGGVAVEGTMPNNGSVSKVLDSATQSYVIPAGYHDGTGSVSISAEQKTATPSETQQNIVPTTGKVLTQVTVQPIPSQYKDVSGVTAVAKNVLVGDKFVNAQGELVDGTMPNNGATGGTIDGLTTTSMKIPSGYTSGGTVSLDGSIEEALAAI